MGFLHELPGSQFQYKGLIRNQHGLSFWSEKHVMHCLGAAIVGNAYICQYKSYIEYKDYIFFITYCVYCINKASIILFYILLMQKTFSRFHKCSVLSNSNSKKINKKRFELLMFQSPMKVRSLHWNKQWRFCPNYLPART